LELVGAVGKDFGLGVDNEFPPAGWEDDTTGAPEVCTLVGAPFDTGVFGLGADDNDWEEGVTSGLIDLLGASSEPGPDAGFV
jgi:hypothetical protein